MDFAKAIGGFVLLVVVIAVRIAWTPPKADPAVAQEAIRQKEAKERAAHLSAKGQYLHTSPKGDYAILFPEKPHRAQFVIIGENDDDWSLIWKYDTTFSAHRAELDGWHRKNAAADRQALQLYQQRVIKHHNGFVEGKPEAWVITGERDLTIDDQWQVREFRYSYRKYTTELERAGRVWLVRIPGAIIKLHVDGEPDVIDSPLAESFFQSFACVPVK